MARGGVTYEQVKQAAELLLTEGKRPTIERIRQRLGETGSFGTISKHLNNWRADSVQIASGISYANLEVLTQEEGGTIDAVREQVRATANIEVEKFKKQIHEQLLQYKNELSKVTQERDECLMRLSEIREENQKQLAVRESLEKQIIEKEAHCQMLLQDKEKLSEELKATHSKDLNENDKKHEILYKEFSSKVEKHHVDLKNKVIKTLLVSEAQFATTEKMQEQMQNQFRIILDILAEKFYNK